MSLSQQIVQQYSDALALIEKTHPSSAEVLEVLIARDEVYRALCTPINTGSTPEQVVRLLELDEQLDVLDERLRCKAKLIALAVSLEKWRTRFQVSAPQWWWYFPIIKVGAWERLDWLFSALTIGVLALSASFISEIIGALSVGNMTIGSTFSTIAQVGGLALLGQSALTRQGREIVQKFLDHINISGKYQGILIFFLSLLLLSTVYFSLTTLSDYYLEEGAKQYVMGDLNEAELLFQRGLEIHPDNSSINRQLGQIYESLGNLEEAITQYTVDAETGSIRALNNLGRAYINRIDPLTEKPDPQIAEAFLLLGLQRANSQNVGDDMRYQLTRNVAWAQLQQGKLVVAEKMAQEAIMLDRKIPGDQTGGGMAYCFLAQIYTQLDRAAAARPLWRSCLEQARPETIYEYRWFFTVKQDTLARCINTARVLTGLARYNVDAKEECRTLYQQLP